MNDGSTRSVHAPLVTVALPQTELGIHLNKDVSMMNS